jgi:hypothetical protein
MTSDGTLTIAASLVLSPDEALVLHAYLGRTIREGASVVDRSEQRDLWGAKALLESALVVPFEDDYASALPDARASLRDET